MGTRTARQRIEVWSMMVGLALVVMLFVAICAGWDVDSFAVPACGAIMIHSYARRPADPMRRGTWDDGANFGYCCVLLGWIISRSGVLL